jgi:hypothetical protein
MEAILSSETLVHTGSTRRYIPEDSLLHGCRRENLKSYILQFCSTNRVFGFLLGVLGSYLKGKQCSEGSVLTFRFPVLREVYNTGVYHT